MYYQSSRLVDELITQEANELYAIITKLQEVQDQLFIETATWGLSTWENLAGITVDPISSYEDRRSHIKSKLRGTGTVTVGLIQSVAESFVYGTVTVIEHPDESKVEIKFSDTHGIPSNLSLIKNALTEIVPAHLGIEFTYNYRTWDIADQMTWDIADTMTWDEFEIL